MTDISATTEEPRAGRTPLGLTGLLLALTSWASAAIFGIYVIGFYGRTWGADHLSRWNDTLPRLYETATPFATIAIAAHFVTGASLLLLGPVQLYAPLRERAPSVHRWLGRLYVSSAAIAGLAGLLFILAKGTVGGPIMDVGFGLYGALVLVAAVETFRHARARRLIVHRRWGVRLFALVIGSWLYRIEYGFWFALMGKMGHTHGFSGPFDHVMAFLFYLPNLVVAEFYVRSAGGAGGTSRRIAAGFLSTGILLIVLATYYFTRHYWGPGIVGAI